jgi:UDP-glucose 4-epimerase
MKVLITGSSGYLGSLLSDFLIARNIEVAGIDLKSPPYPLPENHFKFHTCDITNKDYLAFIIGQEKPTHVVHLASTFNKVRNRQREHHIDIGGSSNILDIVNATPSINQLIYSSSATTYGGYKTNPEWIRESQPLRPGKYRYGLNKSLVEQMFSSTPVRKNLRILTLRLCTVTGPLYSSERNVINLLTRSPILPRFCMQNKIQLLHEEDFLSLMYKILLDDQIAGTYNMAPDSCSYIHDLAPDKKYLPLPVSCVSAVLWILWHLRLMNLQPVSINNGIYPIIPDPAKLMKRYGYAFKYTTAEVFCDISSIDSRMAASSSSGNRP